MTITTPALSLRSGYTTQVRIGVPPDGSLMSTYSPWRGDFSRAALACCSDGGRFSSRAGTGAAAACAGGAAAAFGGSVAGACAVKRVAARRMGNIFGLLSESMRIGSGRLLLRPEARLPPFRPGHRHNHGQGEQRASRPRRIEERIAGHVVAGGE